MSKYLNNIIEQVLEDLGPIIGYRKRWENGRIVGTSGVCYSKIIEIKVKKLTADQRKNS